MSTEKREINITANEIVRKYIISDSENDPPTYSSLKMYSAKINPINPITTETANTLVLNNNRVAINSLFDLADNSLGISQEADDPASTNPANVSDHVNNKLIVSAFAVKPYVSTSRISRANPNKRPIKAPVLNVNTAGSQLFVWLISESSYLLRCNR